jgi:hypothetical protein
MKLRLWAAFECDFPAYILISFHHPRSLLHFQSFTGVADHRG